MMDSGEREAAVVAEEEVKRRDGEEPAVGAEASGAVVDGPAEGEAATTVFYKTKAVDFLGRSTPIILQNDNGPCPLLAICNVLLLRNNISLSLDTTEVSQQKLLALVAGRLLDSNSNLEGKDEGFIRNQQKNISDAIDLLPRLASGIDVNVLFRKINDFEFTSECAIFDLLDIGLYHGWIVDPQDEETAQAIGSKSYNALVGELVAQDAKSHEEGNQLIEENSVDFAAATTATLGVPSPCLSRSLSYNDYPISVPDEQKSRRGDLEEEAELMRVLKLSTVEQTTPLDANSSDTSASSEGNGAVTTSESYLVSKDLAAHHDLLSPEKSNQEDLLETPECNQACDLNDKILHTDKELEFEKSSASSTVDGHNDDSVSSGVTLMSNNAVKTAEPNSLTQEQTFYFNSHKMSGNSSSEPVYECTSVEDRYIPPTVMEKDYRIKDPDHADDIHDSEVSANVASSVTNLEPSSEEKDTESFVLNTNEIEPIYEGEECILDSAPPDYGIREPVYEGEVILAKQADQGHLIRNFLKDNASQLTVYGLFSLQEGLKERELCVFFRNNHFNTMFKYNGELYLLATDQGYINQQDLVWEKLNEVNGDTMFMTGDFKEFMAGNQTSWDENEYLAMEGSSRGNMTFTSDHQLAMELQKQEYEQQQHQQPQKPQPISNTGRSKLITGPQVSRHSASSSPRQDPKSKEKCAVM